GGARSPGLNSRMPKRRPKKPCGRGFRVCASASVASPATIRAASRTRMVRTRFWRVILCPNSNHRLRRSSARCPPASILAAGLQGLQHRPRTDAVRRFADGELVGPYRLTAARAEVAVDRAIIEAACREELLQPRPLFQCERHLVVGPRRHERVAAAEP